MVWDAWLEDVKGKDLMENLRMDGKMVLKWILKVTGCEAVDCIRLSMYKSSGGLF
jgi:hypothetical protein